MLLVFLVFQVFSKASGGDNELRKLKTQRETLEYQKKEMENKIRNERRYSGSNMLELYRDHLNRINKQILDLDNKIHEAELKIKDL